jgi:hypothetical protein
MCISEVRRDDISKRLGWITQNHFLKSMPYHSGTSKTLSVER